MHLDTTLVNAENIEGEAAKMKVEGYRLLTLTCVELDEAKVDILYHFDRGLELRHLRLEVLKGALVPSISALYFSAFLVENEIQDLFGIRFKGLAIDYERTFYLEKELDDAPFCRLATKKS